MPSNYVIRLRSETNHPSPRYDQFDMSVTVMLIFDGNVVHYPYVNFAGGDCRVIDHLNIRLANLQGLRSLCDEIGVQGIKDFNLKSPAGRFTRLTNDNDVQYNFVQTIQSSCDIRLMTVCVDNEPDMLVEEGDESDADLEHFSESEYEVDSDTDALIDVNVGEVPGLRKEGAEVNVEEIRRDQRSVEGDVEGDVVEEECDVVGEVGVQVNAIEVHSDQRPVKGAVVDQGDMQEENDIVQADDTLVSDVESDDEIVRGPWKTFNEQKHLMLQQLMHTLMLPVMRPLPRQPRRHPPMLLAQRHLLKQPTSCVNYPPHMMMPVRTLKFHLNYQTLLKFR